MAVDKASAAEAPQPLLQLDQLKLHSKVVDVFRHTVSYCIR